MGFSFVEAIRLVVFFVDFVKSRRVTSIVLARNACVRACVCTTFQVEWIGAVCVSRR